MKTTVYALRKGSSYFKAGNAMKAGTWVDNPLLASTYAKPEHARSAMMTATKLKKAKLVKITADYSTKTVGVDTKRKIDSKWVVGVLLSPKQREQLGVGYWCSTVFATFVLRDEWMYDTVNDAWKVKRRDLAPVGSANFRAEQREASKYSTRQAAVKRLAQTKADLKKAKAKDLFDMFYMTKKQRVWLKDFLLKNIKVMQLSEVRKHHEIDWDQ